jgi:hypothetical protein
VSTNGQNRWRVPVDRSAQPKQQPQPQDLQPQPQDLQQQQYIDLYQLYEEAVAAGGLSTTSTPLARWRHMATRGVAGVPANHITGVMLQRVSRVASECAGCLGAGRGGVKLHLCNKGQWRGGGLLYEEAVAAGGLSTTSTPLVMWCHMATRGVAGLPANNMSGKMLQS